MKKVKFLKKAVFVLIIFFATGNLYSQMRLKDRYYIGAYGCGLYGQPGAIYYYSQSSPHWANYDELYFSFNHQYLPGNMNWNYEQSNPPMIGISPTRPDSPAQSPRKDVLDRLGSSSAGTRFKT